MQDVMAAMGQIPTRTLGIEFAGEVMRCGQGCTRIRPGMRVTVPHKPSLTAYFVARERRCQEIPDDMDLASAASIPTIHMTVYLALITHGRLQRGETVLIHAAAGGIGQASIQMAQWLGAKVYATVGSNYKKQLLMDRYAIPAERIFSSRDLSFARGIMRATDGKGVDVVVNSLAGEALRASWDCIAAFGRFIELGKRDILNNAGLEMGPFLRHATFSCVNLEILEELDKVAFEELWHKVWELTMQGVIRPVFPINTFHVADAEKAIRLVASGVSAGKVVITTDKTAYSPPHDANSTSLHSQLTKDSHSDLPILTGDDCLLPVTPRKPAKVALDASATYILCGGFGGIGRVIARFLASHGAKHLIMLSRSGATHALHHSLLKDMGEQDVRVTVYNCDISDAAAISTFARTCKEQCWTVKGVVQCAMVLRDRMFENMTYDDWIEATKAKTQGTRYLFDALPSNMDFFIMLSSTSGIIGNKGQANVSRPAVRYTTRLFSTNICTSMLLLIPIWTRSRHRVGREA
jgi:NADPH:quinone reductase-like Zn-dependent oxidoreductase